MKDTIPHVLSPFWSAAGAQNLAHAGIQAVPATSSIAQVIP